MGKNWLEFFILICLFLSGCDNSDFMVSGGTETGNPKTIAMLELKNDSEYLSYVNDQYSKSLFPEDINNKTELEFQKDDYINKTINTNNPSLVKIEKTNQNIFFIVKDNIVNIINAGNPQYLQKINYIRSNGNILSIHSTNDILVIIYIPENGMGEKFISLKNYYDPILGLPFWIPVNASFGILFYDIKDPYNPIWMKDLIIDGIVSNLSIYKNKLIVVSQFLPDIENLEIYFNTNSIETTIESNKEQLEILEIDQISPKYKEIDSQGTEVFSTNLNTNYHYIKNFSHGGSIVNILTFYLDDLTNDFSKFAYISDVHTSYFHEDSLYLISSLYDINDNNINNLISQNINTFIHKLKITDSEPFFVGTKSLKGRLVNKTAINEFDNTLRLFTTSNNESSYTNNFYCLKQIDDNLIIESQLNNFSNDYIYEIEFNKTMIYLAEYNQNSTLYAIDTSNKNHPEILSKDKSFHFIDRIYSNDDSQIIIHHENSFDSGNNLAKLNISICNLFENKPILSQFTIDNLANDPRLLKNRNATAFDSRSQLIAISSIITQYEDYENNISNEFSGTYLFNIQDKNNIEFIDKLNILNFYKDLNNFESISNFFIDNYILTITKDAIISGEINNINDSLNIFRID